MCRKRTIIAVSILSFSILVLAFNDIGSAAEASNYPERDIVCVVPFRAGGGSDLIARITSRYLGNYLPRKTNIIVQNVDAAGGRVGCFTVYDAKPDGYTIGVLEPTIFIMAEAMGELGKRNITHLTWLQRPVDVPYMLAVSQQSGIKSLQDLKGRRVRAAASHSTLTSSVSILKAIGADAHHIIYSGGSDCCLAAMRGDVEVVVQVTGTVMRQAEASGGRLIPLVVLTESRIPIAPNLPTAKELSVDFPENAKILLSYDYVYAAPYGLPPTIYKVLSEALDKTIHDRGFVEEIDRAKLAVAVLTPEEVQKRISVLQQSIPQFLETVRKALGK
jgi:tripartite-type tricarboxylate transporter receptor subunit TctC